LKTFPHTHPIFLMLPPKPAQGLANWHAYFRWGKRDRTTRNVSAEKGRNFAHPKQNRFRPTVSLP
jgi:hypothetical protein